MAVVMLPLGTDGLCCELQGELTKRDTNRFGGKIHEHEMHRYGGGDQNSKVKGGHVCGHQGARSEERGGLP